MFHVEQYNFIKIILLSGLLINKKVSCETLNKRTEVINLMNLRLYDFLTTNDY